MATIYRYERGRFERQEMPVVKERPLTLLINGREFVTLLCTPVKLEALILGFLRFEGVIRDLEEVQDLQVFPEDGLAEVRLAKELELPKRRIITSGCTGGLTFSLELQEHRLPDEVKPLRVERVFPLMHQLFQAAALYRESRGIHAAALADREKVLIVAEDVGRHNAVDKVQGEALLQRIPTEGKILLSTGRISSEMLRKGARMGTPFICSRTSPTALAIEGAKRLGITLIGYIRPDSFNCYTHPEQLEVASKAVASTAPSAVQTFPASFEE